MIPQFSIIANSLFTLQKLRGKDQSISSPNSPTHHHYPSSQPDLRASTTHHHPHHHPTHQQEAGTTQHSHRSTSAPHQLSHDPSHGQSHDSLTDKKERAATIPRGLTEPAPELQTFKPIGILKPPSASSVYDNVTGTDRKPYSLKNWILNLKNLKNLLKTKKEGWVIFFPWKTLWVRKMIQ